MKSVWVVFPASVLGDTCGFDLAMLSEPFPTGELKVP